MFKDARIAHTLKADNFAVFDMPYALQLLLPIVHTINIRNLLKLPPSSRSEIKSDHKLLLVALAGIFYMQTRVALSLISDD